MMVPRIPLAQPLEPIQVRVPAVVTIAVLDLAAWALVVLVVMIGIHIWRML